MAKRGRPTKYKKNLCQKLIKYFDIEPNREITLTHTNPKNGQTWETFETVANDLPTLVGFASLIKVSEDTIYEWAKKHKEFSEAIKKAQAMQKDMWQINSLKGLYNPAFTIFMGKNVFGWRDKTDIDHTTKGEKIEGFNYLPPKPNGSNDTSVTETA